MSRRAAPRALVPALLALAACSKPEGPATRSTTPQPVAGVVRTERVAGGLEHPWALAFLPDGRLLVTERPGRLRVVGADGRLSAPVRGVPAVWARGQGGLLDVAIAPDFATSRLVYLSFAEPGENGSAGTAVARGRLADDAASLTDVQVIYRQLPKVVGPNHFGSRLAFGRDGTLFITQGDRYEYRDQVQDSSSLLGKVVRIAADGAIPPDNPYVGTAGARPEIWSIGHRNVQAAAVDPATGRLWTVEHGARGGDELNAPEKRRNYGWPVITYGVDYSGVRIGEGTAKPGMEQPVYYWDPVIAPSGLAIYDGDAFPQWKGHFFVGSLSPGALVRLEVRDGRVVAEERYLGDLGARIRDVQQGPDGFLYVVTDAADGAVLRVRPAR